MDNDTENLTVEEAAEIAGVTIPTIHRWINAKMLGNWERTWGKKTTKVVKRSELDALLAERNKVVKVED